MLVKIAHPLRILLVEKNEDLVALLTAVLESTGYTVKSVSTGAQALVMVSNYVPNVVFTSIMVGAVNGFDLCRYLRGRPETANALIVAITGLGMDCRDNARSDGFDQFLMKPVELDTILATMQHLGGYLGKTVPNFTFSLSD